MKDAYKSLIEALSHGGIANKVKVNLDWIESEVFENEIPRRSRTRQRHSGARRLRPARRRGQDPRGAVRARAQRALFRHLLRHADGGDRGRAQSGRHREANSTEFGPTPEPVVGLMTEWLRGNELEKRRAGDLGGTMRLGAYEAVLKRGSRVSPNLWRRPRFPSATATATRSTPPIGPARAARHALLRHVARRRAAGDRRI
jgi:CTP synthase